MIHTTSWPYANEIGITEKLSCDLLVLRNRAKFVPIISQ